jgi:hypothetical protein
MGGPNSGGRPDRGARRRVGDLRAQGLALAAIGRRLGLSRQHVHHYKARRRSASGTEGGSAGHRAASTRGSPP